MSDNLVIPLNNPSTNLPASPYSLGTAAKDVKDPPNNTSAISTVNVLSSVFGSALGPTSRNSMSNVLSGYFKQYATGTSLFYAGTNNSDIRMSSLVNAQALFVTISAFRETQTQYHTAKDAKIQVGFTQPDTWQRTVASWIANDSSAKVGSYTITLNGSTSTVISGDPYSTANYTVSLASGLSDGVYQITIRDNTSRFYMTTTVTCPYGGAVAANIYDRVPNRQRLNNGAWTTNTSQGYN